MKKYFISRIRWIPPEKGGRKKLPIQGMRYCPLIHVENDNGFWEDWSVDFICPDFNETNIIQFKFLVDNAPYESLEIGSMYDVYEGDRKVATIEILDWICVN